MELKEIVEQIKESQIKVLEIEKQINDLELDKLTLNVELEGFKLTVARQVYFSDDYKNDKQREVALKEICKESSIYSHFSEDLLDVNEQIKALEFNRSLEMINLTSYKNFLRVAEIEAMKIKAGV